MNHANAEALSEDQDQQLDRAIEELRGVLQQEEKGPPDDGSATASSSSVIMDIPVDVQIVLGATEMAVSELMTLQKGSTVALDRRIGEPIDVVVNGRRIARGELTVLETDSSRFAVRLTEIITAKST
ncbi:flagellar motor switch protein FliN [Aquamicrobium ahrensii]|uniref:Flagellar motor switch protein FliN n=1 Tax=Aquamicrobium ahrensii TaxID=469551 RepID=A0ABV2KLK0_9HYPH